MGTLRWSFPLPDRSDSVSGGRRGDYCAPVQWLWWGWDKIAQKTSEKRRWWRWPCWEPGGCLMKVIIIYFRDPWCTRRSLCVAAVLVFLWPRYWFAFISNSFVGKRKKLQLFWKENEKELLKLLGKKIWSWKLKKKKNYITVCKHWNARFSENLIWLVSIF